MRQSAIAVRQATVLAALCAVTVGFLTLPATAFAFQEPNDQPGGPPDCQDCHFDYYLNVDACTNCHADKDTVDENSSDDGWGFEFNRPGGPHNGYLTTTSKCRTCHSVHNAPAGGTILLPEATIYGTCFTCHDGTGGWGVYGVIAKRGVSVSDLQGHGLVQADGTYVSTNIVPGGDSNDGSDRPGAFSGAGGVLMCNDCHNPHDADTVNPFVGDRVRMRQSSPVYTSSKLLKRRPTGAPKAANDYGSDWCLTCHQGRDSESATVHNHPVETVASAAAAVPPLTAFTYANVARLVSDDVTGVTEWGPLGGITTDAEMYMHWGPLVGADNRGFLMPWPRTQGPGGQKGHAPICQQCHEDSRSVGTLDATGALGDAAPATVAYGDSVTWNGTAWVTSIGDNPRFQNFPHETVNENMLVETYDDLCLNCHPTAQLP